MTVDLMDFFAEQPFISATDNNPIRMQALDLFDRCLAEGDGTPVMAFIEKQIILDPPDLQLLGEIADDLQQRLMSLRANHFDTRISVVKAFATMGVDVTAAVPANALMDYHRIRPGTLITLAYKQGTPLNHAETSRLVRLVEESTRTAARLAEEIAMATALQDMINDWLDALSVTTSRRYWPQTESRESYIQ
jgi:hypothetical protein